MSRIRAWWCGLKEWQRVLLTVPLAIPMALLAGPVAICWMIYSEMRDTLDDFMGRPDDR